MSNYKAELKKLEEQTKAATEEDKIREHDLKCGLASEIVDKYFNKESMKWEVEFAKQILKDKEKENKKKC